MAAMSFLEPQPFSEHLESQLFPVELDEDESYIPQSEYIESHLTAAGGNVFRQGKQQVEAAMYPEFGYELSNPQYLDKDQHYDPQIDGYGSEPDYSTEESDFQCNVRNRNQDEPVYVSRKIYAEQLEELQDEKLARNDIMAQKFQSIANGDFEQTAEEYESFTSATHKRSREDVNGADKKWPGWPGENVFRLVIQAQKVGPIIGRQGMLIKKMCDETKARIKILDGVPGSTERIVLVCGREDPDAALSPAMDALLKVHRRVIGIDIDRDSGDAIVGAAATSRLLVPATQAGSLIGRQGTTIKSFQDISGATIRVLQQLEDMPLFALQDDRVVEIHGEQRKVHRAMELVISHLRKFLVDRSVLPLFEQNCYTPNQSQMLPSSKANPGYGGLSHENYYSDERESQHQSVPGDSRDSSMAKPIVTTAAAAAAAAAPPSVSLPVPVQPVHPVPPALPAPVITQVTQHMQIPLAYTDAIIGTAGANISYMRRTSGASIVVKETPSVPGEMTVQIQGTASQVQDAQQMVERFLAQHSLYATVYPVLPTAPGVCGTNYRAGAGLSFSR